MACACEFCKTAGRQFTASMHGRFQRNPEAWKQWQAAYLAKPKPQKSRGLGDTIAAVTTALGIPTCGGCKKRQEALNRLVPYKGGSPPSDDGNQ